jgi:hypothetical protein
MASSTDANIRTVQTAYAAFGRGDIAAVLAALDPKIVWVNPGTPQIRYFGTHYGREAVADRVFGFLREHLRISKLEPRQFLAGEDKVVVILDMEATAIATGRSFTQEVVHLWTLADGLLVRFHDFQDSYAVASALDIDAGRPRQ